MRPQNIPFTPEERVAAFWAKVDPCRTDGCALWLGSTNRDGYGTFRVDGRTTGAHQFLIGKAPKGLEWDHVRERCSHRNCVWPDHLEAVTHKQNVLRGRGQAALNKSKTHCPQGHPYDLINTYWINGNRQCRACWKTSPLPWPRTHCKRGHEYNSENTRIRANGSRRCLPCERIHEANRPPRRTKRQHLNQGSQESVLSPFAARTNDLQIT